MTTTAGNEEVAEQRIQQAIVKVIFSLLSKNKDQEKNKATDKAVQSEARMSQDLVKEPPNIPDVRAGPVMRPQTLF